MHFRFWVYPPCSLKKVVKGSRPSSILFEKKCSISSRTELKGPSQETMDIDETTTTNTERSEKVIKRPLNMDEEDNNQSNPPPSSRKSRTKKESDYRQLILKTSYSLYSIPINGSLFNSSPLKSFPSRSCLLPLLLPSSNYFLILPSPTKMYWKQLHLPKPQ